MGRQNMQPPTLRLSACAMMLMAYPPQPLTLRQMLQKGQRDSPRGCLDEASASRPPPPAPKPLHSSAIDSLPSPSLHALPAVAAHEGHRGLAQAAELNRPAAAAALELHLELEGSAVDLDELREG